VFFSVSMLADHLFLPSKYVWSVIDPSLMPRQIEQALILHEGIAAILREGDVDALPRLGGDGYSAAAVCPARR
jgi:hypothetical protein